MESTPPPPMTAAADDGSAGGGGDVNSVVTPVACAGTGPNPNAIDKYSQGYTQDPNILSQVQMKLASLSLADEAAQMRGMPYGNVVLAQLHGHPAQRRYVLDSRVPVPRRLAGHESGRGHGRLEAQRGRRGP